MTLANRIAEKSALENELVRLLNKRNEQLKISPVIDFELESKIMDVGESIDFIDRQISYLKEVNS